MGLNFAWDTFVVHNYLWCLYNPILHLRSFVFVIFVYWINSMSIKNSPLLTCTFHTLSALGCSHSLHYPVAAEDTSYKMEGLGKMGILLKM